MTVTTGTITAKVPGLNISVAVPIEVPVAALPVPAWLRLAPDAPILCLSLSRPWPWAIFHLPPGKAKRVENRDKRFASLIEAGIVALHAAESWDIDAPVFIERLGGLPVPAIEQHPQGIIGFVRFTRLVERDSFDGYALYRQHEWFAGPWGHVFDEAWPLPEPEPCRGKPAPFVLPPTVAEKVRAQLAR